MGEESATREPGLAANEKLELHRVLSDGHANLRASWGRTEEGFSRGLFYNVGPSLTRGLTPVQYTELVNLARKGLVAQMG